ncbi:MAG TPA: hypothetical protein DD490_33130 [Acidobacteria bacterium]|nr:hypothetical protein [Acidobacteriota bacterium]
MDRPRRRRPGARRPGGAGPGARARPGALPRLRPLSRAAGPLWPGGPLPASGPRGALGRFGAGGARLWPAGRHLVAGGRGARPDPPGREWRHLHRRGRGRAGAADRRGAAPRSGRGRRGEPADSRRLGLFGHLARYPSGGFPHDRRKSLSGNVPLTVLVTTRNEELNLERTLQSVHGFADQILVIDSESTDRTQEIARQWADEVHNLPYEHGRIIPWIFQWGLEHLPIRNEWILILEADQAVTPALRAEIAALLARPEIRENGFYLRRRQIFRGKPLRFGGYGGKHLMKLFRRGHGALDPVEQDTRVYIQGPVGRLRAPLEEHNRKEDSILFYLEKHLRYADAFAREEVERRRGLPWRITPRLFGAPDERVLWLKTLWYRMPLYVRPFLYFIYRYFVLLGILDGKNGLIFHFLQAFWFRFVVDVRLDELQQRQDP